MNAVNTRTTCAQMNINKRHYIIIKITPPSRALLGQKVGHASPDLEPNLSPCLSSWVCPPNTCNANGLLRIARTSLRRHTDNIDFRDTMRGIWFFLRRFSTVASPATVAPPRSTGFFTHSGTNQTCQLGRQSLRTLQGAWLGFGGAGQGAPCGRKWDTLRPSSKTVLILAGVRSSWVKPRRAGLNRPWSWWAEVKFPIWPAEI